MFKKAKYISALVLFFIVMALFLFSSNLYAAWIFDASPPDMEIELVCNNASFDDNDQCPGDSITVIFKCKEDGAGQSGCKTIEYGTNTVSKASCVINDSAENPVPTDPDFSTDFVILNDGKTHYLCVESTDRAGNTRIGAGEGLLVTPIIPPVFIGSWFKLKDASFNSVSGRSINLPSSPQKYEDDDEDDTLDTNLIIESGGVVLSPSTYTITGWQYSDNDWNNQDYEYKNTFSPENYKDYILSSTEYNEITDLAKIQTDEVNYYVGDDINSSNVSVANAPFILLVDGNITFDDVDFNASNSSVALIVTGNITINPTTTSIGGIIATTNISLGDSSTPLKITGNIISTAYLNLQEIYW